MEAGEEIKDCMDSVRKGVTDDQAVFTVYVTLCAVNLLPPRMMGGFAANTIYGMKIITFGCFLLK